MSLIEIRNLRKEYSPDVVPLKGVNADIEAGEVISIIGPSGTGKSTLPGHRSGQTAKKHGNGLSVLQSLSPQNGSGKYHAPSAEPVGKICPGSL